MLRKGSRRRSVHWILHPCHTNCFFQRLNGGLVLIGCITTILFVREWGTFSLYESIEPFW